MSSERERKVAGRMRVKFNMSRFFKVLTCSVLGHKFKGVNSPCKLSPEGEPPAGKWLRTLFFGETGRGFVIATVCRRCQYVELYALQHEDDPQ